MIDNLMNAQDNFEIVRDKIAVILASEIASQQALAITEGKDPNDYYARVYVERVRAFEQFLNVPVTDDSPLINVSFDSSNFTQGNGNTVSRQKSATVYNLDCYGYASAKTSGVNGQEHGDTLSNFAVQKAIRIARNILMAAEYAVLDMQGIVWKRWIENIETFQPIIDSNPIQNVIGARISFSVDFNEFAPQVTPVELLEVNAGVKWAPDGQVIIEASYDYN